MKRTLCVVTSSRADYGHLKGVIKEIQKDRDLRLQLVVTGSHLSARHGLTYRDIERDGFRISAKVNIGTSGDTDERIAQTIGLTCGKFSRIFRKLKPDIVVLLGDRYEIFAVAVAAHVMRIPVAHLHGGETTQGAIDEAFRHAITKMACIHFPATEEYRRRIIQLGENPKLIFNYGSPGLDGFNRQKFLNKKKLAASLRFDLVGPVAIVTYHPVTLEKEDPARQVKNMLDAVSAFNFKAVFTAANADAHGALINRLIRQFAQRNPKKYKFIVNLGQERYFSCLKHFDLMIGNSSSGIVEAPSFQIPVVNIGDRQKGRIKAGNVIDVAGNKISIAQGIRMALSSGFKKKAGAVRNPYMKFTDGRACFRVKERLKSLKIDDDLLKKEFLNLAVK